MNRELSSTGTLGPRTKTWKGKKTGATTWVARNLKCQGKSAYNVHTRASAMFLVDIIIKPVFRPFDAPEGRVSIVHFCSPLFHFPRCKDEWSL